MKTNELFSDKYVGFTVTNEKEANEVALKFKETNAEVKVDGNKISILLPKGVKKGTLAVSADELAFVLESEKRISNSPLANKIDHCCGDGGGCCVNWR